MSLSNSSAAEPAGTYKGLSFAMPGVGDWIERRIDFQARGISGFVPSGFDAYAVIFHPAYREVGAGKQPTPFAPYYVKRVEGRWVQVDHREVTWAEVAAANDRVAHAGMEWAAITGHWAYRWNGDQAGIWDIGPQHGSLPKRQMIRLTELLAQFTTTPDDCFFGLSPIYGDLPRELERTPSVAGTQPLAGSLGALRDISFSDQESTGHRSPNLWWPRDRAWCLVSDYDWQESFFGGSVDCVERLVSDGVVEAMRIDADGRLDDPVNPEPAGSYSG